MNGVNNKQITCKKISPSGFFEEFKKDFIKQKFPCKADICYTLCAQFVSICMERFWPSNPQPVMLTIGLHGGPSQVQLTKPVTIFC